MSRSTQAVLEERIGHEHLAATSRALDTFVGQLPRLERWGRHLAVTLHGGGRVLVAGNGGSAALAQHLTSELVGRYHDERDALSAIALHSDTSTLTALVNDYGIAEMFARQVRAHGRRGDILIAISTSGRSENVIAAVAAAREREMATWAFTGSVATALERASDECIVVPMSSTAIVQEVQQVAIHILCETLDEEVRRLAQLPGLTIAMTAP
jgi:D-sedoheptulose 7-phosphate isomerase